MKFFTRKILTKENYNKALELLKELRDKSRLEQGCIYYDLYSDVDSPYTIIINEEWENLEFQQKHAQSEHFKRIVPLVAELVKEKSSLIRFDELKEIK